MSETKKNAVNEVQEIVETQQSGNKRIQDGNYEKALAVKCINGTLSLRMEKR